MLTGSLSEVDVVLSVVADSHVLLDVVLAQDQTFLLNRFDTKFSSPRCSQMLFTFTHVTILEHAIASKGAMKREGRGGVTSDFCVFRAKLK